MSESIQQLLVVGKNGQLAQSIAKIEDNYPAFQITYSDRTELNLADFASIERYFKQRRFDIIINAAAYTAVDKAESEPQQADQINHLAVKQLAEIAKQQRSVLIHISTDYVFDGEKNTPYREDDPAYPVNVYGKSKRKGEVAVEGIAPMGCIVRSSWLYSEFGNNFIKTMLRLGAERNHLNVVYDQIGSPTYATDLAHTLLTIAKHRSLRESTEKLPIYHYASEGVCSWYDLAQAIFQLNDTVCEVYPVASEQYPTPATRPHYSLLSKEKIKQQFKITIPYWRDALNQCLQEINNGHE